MNCANSGAKKLTANASAAASVTPQPRARVPEYGDRITGDEGPEESITFVYGKLGAKVNLRGRDPATKTE